MVEDQSASAESKAEVNDLDVAWTRVLAGLLFQVQSRDPFVFAVVPLLLLAVAALAIVIPARRASRVDPAIALRAE